MGAGGFFCVHKRLRTSCPECRPPPPPPPAPTERPVAPAPTVAEKPEGPRALGRPVARRSKRVSREEAENAEAWWVPKDRQA